MMIEGDVLLRGQGTDDQQLIPIMAHPPQTDSDITLYEWLQLATNAHKGIKLDFKSIESVDLALQIVEQSKAKVCKKYQHLIDLSIRLVYMRYNHCLHMCMEQGVVRERVCVNFVIVCFILNYGRCLSGNPVNM